MEYHEYGERLGNWSRQQLGRARRIGNWPKRGLNWLGNTGMGRAFREMGWQGVGKAAYEGASASIGIMRNPAGKMRFLGGAPVGRTLMGVGIGAGIGAAVYAATDNPLYGIAAGGVSSIAMAGFKGATRAMMPAFTLYSMYEGYKEGGVGGALWAGAKEAATFAAFDVGMKAVSIAFKGSGLGTLARLAMNPWTAGLAVIGAGTYFGAKKLADVGRRSVQTEFAGDTTPFMTQAAYTMRQRALQEINRSHTNSRTILGSEAQLMHFS